ncbi:hypothetical protein [Vulgatibacter incomptus]|uniref:hypothetical protein n=1 Tax=Vulgatibacter incomptus TaxID=1391653 RepID=UPI0014707ABF|nr:hypothetical protein [Vulgatibacter incomptus]
MKLGDVSSFCRRARHSRLSQIEVSRIAFEQNGVVMRHSRFSLILLACVMGALTACGTAADRLVDTVQTDLPEEPGDPPVPRPDSRDNDEPAEPDESTGSRPDSPDKDEPSRPDEPTSEPPALTDCPTGKAMALARHGEGIAWGIGRCGEVPYSDSSGTYVADTIGKGAKTLLADRQSYVSFSPDRSRILSTYQVREQPKLELRVFDLASRKLVGKTILANVSSGYSVSFVDVEGSPLVVCYEGRLGVLGSAGLETFGPDGVSCNGVVSSAHGPFVAAPGKEGALLVANVVDRTVREIAGVEYVIDGELDNGVRGIRSRSRPTERSCSISRRLSARRTTRRVARKWRRSSTWRPVRSPPACRSISLCESSTSSRTGSATRPSSRTTATPSRSRGGAATSS